MSLCFVSGSLNPFTDSNFVMNAQLDEYHFLTPIKIIMACSHGKKKSHCTFTLAIHTAERAAAHNTPRR